MPKLERHTKRLDDRYKITFLKGRRINRQVYHPEGLIPFINQPCIIIELEGYSSRHCRESGNDEEGVIVGRINDLELVGMIQQAPFSGGWAEARDYWGYRLPRIEIRGYVGKEEEYNIRRVKTLLNCKD